ncbi:CehA/McbA family metallohydrolase domain-containing protein [Nodularia spumigena]|uniref:hypothetical protein n=1 Tax=Nodularia spumigena TaxID=70799 RepID=UPI002B1EBBAD|nr:hypothetical protein [Nodularia spumigena]
MMLLGTLLGVGPALASEPVAQDPPMRWWRGNLHTHTFWSDGDDFPEMVSEWYREQGFHFLAISDHNTLNAGDRWISLADVDRRSRGQAFPKYLDRFGASWVETRPMSDGRGDEVRLKPMSEYRALVEERGRFMLFEAEEITGSADDGRAIHMNATNLPVLIEPKTGATVADVIRRNIEAVHAVGAESGRQILVHVNHPNYKWGVTAEDLASIIDEPFFEVWNGVDGDDDPGDADHPSTEEIWDIASTLRMLRHNAPPLFGLATDDSHDYHQTTIRAMPGRAWIQVRATHLTPESIIRSIRRGDFYASSGVELDEIAFDAASKTLRIRIKPEPGVNYTTTFIGTRDSINLVAQVRRNASGDVIESTLDYSASTNATIGEPLHTDRTLTPSYTLRGDELYVRAVIVSDAVPEFPSRENLLKKAWTQPVGWERHVPDQPAARSPAPAP